MVAGIRRSLSLPGGPGTSAPSSCSLYTNKKPFHARSTSLPSRSHPGLAQFEDKIQSLCSLPAQPYGANCDVASWFADGLGRINGVHAALADLLHLPKARDSAPLRGDLMAAAWLDRLLDDALRLAEAYATLRSATADLKHHIAEARAAIRRGDSARLSSAMRSHRHAEKELARLATATKNLTKPSLQLNIETVADAAEVEVAGIVREVIVATASASATIFGGIVAMSSAAAAAVASTSKDSRAIWSFKRLTSPRSMKKRKGIEEAAEIVALEKLDGLEECIERLDQGSEKVFRSLVNTRVSLLNILTPSL